MGSSPRSLRRRITLPRISLPNGPRLRRRLLIAGLVAIALCALYLFWFRESSFVAVEDVTVSGAGSKPEIEATLRSSALEQSTLAVDAGALEAAVSSDPAVRSVSTEPDFPHGLAIAVDLREPVGYLSEERLVVAGDGMILEEAGSAPDGVALIDAPETASGPSRIEGDALTLAAVLGGAPESLLAEAESVGLDPDYGVVVALEAGIDLRFGSSAEPELKWKAAAAVLADPKLEGAEYLDLSVPARPVAGGLPLEAIEEPVVPVEPVEPVVPDPLVVP